MINFFIRRPVIYVDCYTTDISAYRYFPIQETSEFYPTWWKSLTKTYNLTDSRGLDFPLPTMKGCSGFTDLYQQGFTLPLWNDLILETLEQGFRYKFAESDSNRIDPHDYRQMPPDFLNYVHLKIISPWLIEEKSSIKFLFLQPSYSQIDSILDFHVLPGILEFKHQHSTNINVLANKSQRFEFTAGRPMAQLVPLSDKTIIIKNNIVDEKELKTKFLLKRPFFSNSYRKTKGITNSVKSTGCPIKNFLNKK